MLSIKVCRHSLGKYAKDLDDSEVEAIRNLMYLSNKMELSDGELLDLMNMYGIGSNI